MDALKEQGIETEEYGFGALSTDYIKESPKEKGAPDLKITGTEIYIEVTGPDKRLDPEADLWVRWDKFEYAENHPEKEIWVAHILESEDDLIRVLKLGAGVKERYKEIFPEINGIKERYRQIPASDSNIYPFDRFCEYIKSR